MKKIIIAFVALLVAFCGIWVFKFRTPINRPDDDAAAQNSDVWYGKDLPEASVDWVLDPEIPANYIPVPGEDELYMIIDKDGYITDYAVRTQAEDGTWEWKYGINPDIPANYEAVEGLENVYRVTDKDGVHYFKYIRNDDDTFAFVPVDETGHELKVEETPDDNSKIPENYHRIKNNIYAVYNEYGVCIGYKERRYDEETKTYYWVDTEKPETPEDDETTSTQPTVTTPAIDIPEITNPSEATIPTGVTNPTTPSDPSDPTNPTHPTSPTNPTTPTELTDPTDPTEPPTEPPTELPTEPPTENPTVPSGDTSNTYTQVEVVTSTEIKGDWVFTYETTITRVYTREGVLISTKKEGPIEVSKKKLADDEGNIPDPSKIAQTLKAEYARVSVGLAYNTDMAEKVLNLLNIERIAAGVSPMRLEADSTAQMLANIKAADMAIYNHSDFDSPMYGTITELCTRYSITNNGTKEIVWKSLANETASGIATRLQLMHPDLFTKAEYDSIGLAIVQKGGYFYIDFVILL